MEYVMALRMEYVMNEKVEYVIRGVEYVINWNFLKVEYVMEYVMIVESQNSWSMEEIHRNFLMASNVSFGFMWVHFLSYFHFVHLLTTSTTSQNKPYFELQIGISGKAFFWVVKENNEYWTHKSKFDNLFSKTFISLCLYPMIMTFIWKIMCWNTAQRW